jgi:predicted nucleic acid-binding protein
MSSSGSRTESRASAGFTFDTGALIALERGDRRMRVVMRLARLDNVRIVVPTVVLGEWWRGRSKLRDTIVASVQVEPLGESLAKVAGEALTKVRGATFSDAVVMASAAQRGDVVYTSDQGDLDRLWSHFIGVRRLLAAT